ncbi:LysR family transcriptional regulator [Paenalcaligenes niemegkensis]|uniref:LysR family transcriptional regulator n=1 Tax=Paenalcaligenes niemegkensis TaxID=2895469 RepID=UPI001EE86051|nr:LysR family transcriptional regulator [Paenalcaligenes niemegkensis]MCQ9616314.1 LysR family transcriptional regulator [Paenalcaligenes niemegkensis]
MYLFVRVAELGSFAAVAEQQGVDRSAITRQIAALEKHLGVQLIVRSTRRQSLTSAGRLYLERCRAIIDLVDSAETEVMEERLSPKGSIRLSLPISFGVRCLTPILIRFAKDYPEVALQLDYSDDLVNLIEEGFDLAIRVAAEPASNDIVRKLGECKMLVVGSADYFECKGRPAHPADLADHVCLQYQNHSRWSLEIDGETTYFSTSGRIQANNGDALAVAAANGLGLAVLPDFIAQGYLQSGELQSVLDQYSSQRLGIYAVLPTNYYIPQRISLLMEYLAEHLPSALGESAVSQLSGSTVIDQS